MQCKPQSTVRDNSGLPIDRHQNKSSGRFSVDSTLGKNSSGGRHGANLVEIQAAQTTLTRKQPEGLGADDLKTHHEATLINTM